LSAQLWLRDVGPRIIIAIACTGEQPDWLFIVKERQPLSCFLI
jgi:hypothetical protein